MENKPSRLHSRSKRLSDAQILPRPPRLVLVPHCSGRPQILRSEIPPSDKWHPRKTDRPIVATARFQVSSHGLQVGRLVRPHRKQHSKEKKQKVHRPIAKSFYWLVINTNGEIDLRRSSNGSRLSPAFGSVAHVIQLIELTHYPTVPMAQTGQ